jgi:hypothetical protein
MTWDGWAVLRAGLVPQLLPPPPLVNAAQSCLKSGTGWSFSISSVYGASLCSSAAPMFISEHQCKFKWPKIPF